MQGRGSHGERTGEEMRGKEKSDEGVLAISRRRRRRRGDCEGEGERAEAAKEKRSVKD